MSSETKQAQNRAWNEAHPERMREASRKYREAHREEIAAKAREWTAANPEKRKERDRKYREAHRAEVLEQERLHRLAHREERNAHSRLWRERNPETKNAHERNRRARKAGAGGTHSAAEFAELCLTLGNACAYCGATGELHADHVVALAAGGPNSIDNILPACPSCNLRKRTKPVEVFMAELTASGIMINPTTKELLCPRMT